MSEIAFRQNIVATARCWIGTPYVHQASVQGAGSDCLGLVRGVWREVLGDEPETAPDYSMDWGEASNTELMHEAAGRWFVPVAIADARSGDLLLFRWKGSRIARHAGILSSKEKFIHAYEKAGVVETTLGPQWRRRIAAAFRFPRANPIR